MKLVIFGPTVSSSWGNGHATLWRALLSALGRRGHRTVFFERDCRTTREHTERWPRCPHRLFDLPGFDQSRSQRVPCSCRVTQPA